MNMGNEVVGRSKGGKALFSLVPGLALLVESLNEVVGNVIVEALHADVLNSVQRFNGHLVGKVAVAHNGMGSPPHRFHGLQYGKRLWVVPVAVQMEAENKAGFAVRNEPEAVFLTLDIHHGFIGVPSSELKNERRNELNGDIWEQRGKPCTPNC